MRDHDVRKAVLVLEVNEEVHYLSADGHVERGHRLVKSDDLWVQRKCARNTNPLALSAAELMWEERRLIWRQSYLLQEFLNASGYLSFSHRGVDFERLADDAADAHAGIKGRPRVLEHCLHRTSQFTLARAAERRHILAFEVYLAFGRLFKAEHDLQRSGLTAA